MTIVIEQPTELPAVRLRPDGIYVFYVSPVDYRSLVSEQLWPSA